MKCIDLDDEFVKTLYERVPRRADLVNRIADILLIERESAARRLNGKVRFSIQEMGKLADTLEISIDSLLHKKMDYQWIPFLLESPMEHTTMDALYNVLDADTKRIADITKEPSEAGCVYNTLPFELFMYYPDLMKFMIFKWGHYFVGTDEFDNFSQWRVPAKITKIKERIQTKCHFDTAFYIWDNSLIWTLAGEIQNLFKMHILTSEEKDTIKEELKDLMRKLEQMLNGNYVPDIPLVSQMDFYVSMMNLGFTCCYFASNKKYAALFETNFSYSPIEASQESYEKVRDWIKSLRKVSTLLSDSGRIERKLFFERQNQIIDILL